MIHEIMAILAGKRSEFCSEADFQFALGWEIKEKFHDAEIRFEYPALLDGKFYVEIDIVVKLNSEVFPIELKFPTKEGGRTTNNRCDMVRDIERLEKLQSNNLGFTNSRIREGFVIWLTDNEAYREKPASVHECNLNNDVVKKGSYSYTGGKRKGDFIAEIVNNHTIGWKQYKPDDSSNPLWYALISIPPVAK